MFPDLDQLPHAMVFVADDESSLIEAGSHLALRLLGRPCHPDLHEYFPEGKSDRHPIENLRKLSQEVWLDPFEGKWKLFLIHRAERMLPTSSNALLKTFEEPPAQTILVLLTTHPKQLLPTVTSRCQRIDLPSKKRESAFDVLDILRGEIALEEAPDAILESILLWYRDRLLLDVEGGEIYLSFPQHREAIRKTTKLPLSYVEKLLVEARLGLERAISPKNCLDILLLRLNDTEIPQHF